MSADAEARPIDRFLPWSFVLFFVVIVAVNGVMMWIAIDTFTGLEADKSYLRGLGYNRALEAERAQEARGWTVDTAVTESGGRHVDIVLTASDATGRAIGNGTVDIELRRPTQSALDRKFELRETGIGRYTGGIELPAAGVWDLRFRFARGDEVWLDSRRVIVE
jgi:nitrogen fixation protein FixH